MPIYEEKLISPFAVRFSQAQIRPNFKDGRPVEDSCQEITALPGFGGYDVVLSAPFPTIEVTRWTAKGARASSPSSSASTSGSDAEGDHTTGEHATAIKAEEHWFSFDNRRLYCLQKAAARFWPQRVAVIVEVFYTDNGTMRRKCDTTTSGMSVSVVSDNPRVPVAVWNWSHAVISFEGSTRETVDSLEASQQTALEMVFVDTQKSSVDELKDAPPAPGSLMAIALGYGEAPAPVPDAPVRATSPAPSPRENSEKVQPPEAKRAGQRRAPKKSWKPVGEAPIGAAPTQKQQGGRANWSWQGGRRRGGAAHEQYWQNSSWSGYGSGWVGA